MQAITFAHFGDPEVLTLSDEMPEPLPNPQQLLVRVKATGVNRADILQRRGKYAIPPGESDILGLEIAGEVVAVGHDISDFKIGERVFGLVGSGGYAQYCVIDHKVAMRIPDTLSFAEAAAIPENFLTAYEALVTLGQCHPEETVLIHAAGSGVGTAAIQLAKQLGATIHATASQEKLPKLLDLGAHHVINYKTPDFNIPNASVDIIIDFLGGNYFEKNIQALKPGGRLICVGLMNGSHAEIHLDQILSRRLQIKGLIMRTRSLHDKRIMTQRFQERFLPQLEKRHITPIIDSVFPLKEVQAAHARMEANLNFGKIILEIN